MKHYVWWQGILTEPIPKQSEQLLSHRLNYRLIYHSQQCQVLQYQGRPISVSPQYVYRCASQCYLNTCGL